MLCKEIGEQGWKELLAEIRNGNVIPIVGPQLSKIKVNGEEMLLNEYLLKELKNTKGITQETSDFTQLKYSREWRDLMETEDSSLQYEVKLLYDRLRPAAPEYLQKLIKIKEFKLILSTSFDNLVELALLEKYDRKNVKVLHYELKAKYNDITESDLIDENKTILFHMFGKLGDLETSYVLTEDDLLKYMLNWINISSSPKHLINYLQDKYLLVLGCNYPNWLFKFFLHSIKYNIEKNTLNVISKKSVVADFQTDNELNLFLERLKTRFHNNPEAFIDELLQHYDCDNDEQDYTRQSNDIFISYAHEDEELVARIVNELENNKISVWFDRNKDGQFGLETGDKFEKKIQRNIKDSKMFVPILSKNIMADRRFFRREWNCAIDYEKGTYKKYIFPLIIDNDLELNCDAVPDEFKELHMLKIDMVNLKESLQPLIRSINKDKRISMKVL